LILVDTNILLDIATDDSEWFDWSSNAMEEEAVHGPLCVNLIIYAELSVRYADSEAVDAFLANAGVEVLDIPRTGAFLAAKVFGKYRARGGVRTGVLSDFFIGAHAVALDIPILTRDVGRYRTYFPELRLIAPQLN
jgi:predicted nucleic acid-binding protein